MNISIDYKRFTFLFVIGSTIVSFLGDIFFKLFGLYPDRSYFYSKFLLSFAFLVILLLIFFFIAGFIHKERTVSFRAPEESFLKYLTVIGLLMIVPMFVYIMFLYGTLFSSGESLDEARARLQNSIPLLPRFFWYSSFILSYFFVSSSKLNGEYRRLFKFVRLSIILLLLLNGSKSLIFFPILAFVIGHRFSITFKKVFYLTVILLFFVLGSTFYNNIRSSGKFFMTEDSDLAVDVFASFAPEQRDGAYLMEAYNPEDPFGRFYFKETGIFLLRGVLDRKAVNLILGTDTQDCIIQKIYSLQEYLGYPVGGSLNPRIGLIASSYLFYGTKGLLLNMLLYVLGIFILVSFYPLCRSYVFGPMLNYLFVIWIWTYNSDFLINLDFFFYQLYFGVILILLYKLFFKAPIPTDKNKALQEVIN